MNKTIVFFGLLAALMGGCKSSTSPNGDARDEYTFSVYSGATGNLVDTAYVSVDGDTMEEVYSTNGSTVFWVLDGQHHRHVSAPGYDSFDTTFTTPSTANNVAVGLEPVHSLVAQYNFSGSAMDSSGNGHSGTITGGTFVADRFGNVSSALEFNGLSDYITISDAPDLNFGKYDNFAICFWAKFSVPQNQESNVYMVRKGSGDNNTLTGYEIINSGYSFLPEFGTTYGVGVGQQNEVGGDTRWHFFAYEFDRSGTIVFYYDGVASSKTMITGTAFQGNMNTSSPLLIGGDGTMPHSFKGTLDDVRIYKGLLSDVDVNALYHQDGW